MTKADALQTDAIKKSALENIDLFVLDMDGTFYLGDELIEGSTHFLDCVEKCGKHFMFFTNNASKSPQAYIDKLEKMGVYITREQIMTSGDVTIEFLKTYHDGARVYLNGTDILRDSFIQEGINLVDESPDIAIQSFDTQMTYERMNKICRFIRDGATFLSTHMDYNCPVKDGFIPDSGSMCAFITASTGVKPRYLGKPFRETLDMVVSRSGVNAKNIAFVGDRLYTDVATAVNNGASGFLVLSGESDLNTVEESDVSPTAIYDSLGEIAQYL